MNATRWFGNNGRRGRDTKRADRRRRALGLEGLEGRQLLSTIQWNRGNNDGFEVYNALAQVDPGRSNAEVARGIVDQAVLAWQNVIQDFRFQLSSGNTNLFTLNISTFDFTENLGQAQTTGKDLVGKPTSAAIFLDTEGGNAGWYFDARPDDNAEFDRPVTLFGARASGLGNDFYSTILHEIGHAVGIQSGDLRINTGGFLTPIGSGPNQRFAFNGPTTQATLIQDGGLHVDDVAHPDDLMNPDLITSSRYLISDLDAGILADAYGYEINRPSLLQTFFANLDRSTGVLTLNGDLGDDNVDDITIDQFFSAVLVKLDDSSQQDLIFAFPTALVSEIRVLAGAGEDSINIESVFGEDLVTVDGGVRANLIQLAPSRGKLAEVAGTVILRSPTKTDTLTVHDRENSSPTAYKIGSNSVEFQANGGFANGIFFQNVRILTIIGGKGGNTFNHSAFPSVDVQLIGGLGSDTFQVNGLGNSPSFFDQEVRIFDPGGNDQVIVQDEGNAFDSTYTITDTSVTRGLLKVDYSGVDGVNLKGGSGKNTYKVEKTAASTPVVIAGGAGDDTFLVSPVSRRLTDIAGRLTVNGGGGSDRMEVNDGAGSTAAANYTLVGSLLSRNLITHVNAGGVESLSLFGNAFGNTYTVASVDAGTEVFLSGSAGDDTVFLSSPLFRNLDAIAGRVDIRGGGGSDTLVADDSNNAVNSAYRFQTSSLLRNGKTIATFSDGVDDVTFKGGTKGNTFDVNSVAASMDLDIIGGPGTDTYRLAASSGNLDALARGVDINGGGGSDSLLADDSKNAAGATFRVNANSLIRNGKLLASFGGGFGDVEVIGGGGPNTFDVESTSAATPVELFGGAGTDAFRIGAKSQNLNAIAGTVFVSGGGGTDDSLTIDDGLSTAAAAFTLDATSFRRQGGTPTRVNYLNIEDMSILAGSGNDTLTVAGTPSAGDVFFDGGGGTNTLAGGAGEDVFDVQGPNSGALSFPGSAGVLTFAATQNLLGGAGDDTFRFRQGKGFAGILDGQGGSDTLDYATFTTPVAVHLVLGNATGLGAGRALGVENAIGGSGDDAFTGSGADNILVGNGGNDTIAAGAGDDVLVGGDGDDKLLDTTVPDGTERNILIGGRGADVVTGNAMKEEILIGGSTAFDTNLAALRAIMAEWKSAAPLATRVGHLRGTIAGGLNGRFLLRAAGPDPTVVDDAIADILGGGVGPDWFFGKAEEVVNLGPDDILN